MREFPVLINEEIPLKGVIRTPDSPPPYPSVLLCHGTIEHDRDGNICSHPSGKEFPKRNFLLNISHSLCNAGFATFSWDKRGFGESGSVKGDYYSDAEDAALAYRILSHHHLADPDSLIIYGQSAGVHTACLLARAGILPAGYILSGGLCSDYLSMLAFNYLRPVRYARKGLEERAFVMEHDSWGYTLGSHLFQITDAVLKGESKVTIPFNGGSRELPLDLRLYSGELAPINLFHHINAPSLIIHGRKDMNVPLKDAYQVQSCLKLSGIVHDLVTIQDVDHSFQKVPVSQEERIRDRLSLHCFQRPYHEEYYEEIIRFCRRITDA